MTKKKHRRKKINYGKNRRSTFPKRHQFRVYQKTLNLRTNGFEKTNTDDIGGFFQTTNTPPSTIDYSLVPHLVKVYFSMMIRDQICKRIWRLMQVCFYFFIINKQHRFCSRFSFSFGSLHQDIFSYLIQNFSFKSKKGRSTYRAVLSTWVPVKLFHWQARGDTEREKTLISWLPWQKTYEYICLHQIYDYKMVLKEVNIFYIYETGEIYIKGYYLKYMKLREKDVFDITY